MSALHAAMDGDWIAHSARSDGIVERWHRARSAAREGSALRTVHRGLRNIRDAEGRFSESEDFYLELPYKDSQEETATMADPGAQLTTILFSHILSRKYRSVLDSGPWRR